MDLGAGKGLFTNALASRLPPHSTVYAIDKDPTVMRNLALGNTAITLKKLQKDFVSYDLDAIVANGVLMANALHYVSNKIVFLRQLKKHFVDGSRLIIVEYDTDRANAWVPYPIRYASLQPLLEQSGFHAVEKMDETPSLFNNNLIYSAVAVYGDER
jgi:hypothetical protein